MVVAVEVVDVVFNTVDVTVETFVVVVVLALPPALNALSNIAPESPPPPQATSIELNVKYALKTIYEGNLAIFIFTLNPL